MNRYAVADLHGQLDLLLQIKEYINEDDIFYILGDSGDRGPQPWRTLKACLDDPQVVYLMGNHDAMLVDAAKAYLRDLTLFGYCHFTDYIYDTKHPIGLLHLNGGMGTFEGWMDDKDRMKYLRQLQLLPLEIRLAAVDEERIISLSHAGYTDKLDNPTAYNLLWSRDHIYDVFQTDILVIHGHTPCSYIKRKLQPDQYDDTHGYLMYNYGTKICIDMGSAYTNETILLNIDTFEGIKFTTEGENVDGAQGK